MIIKGGNRLFTPRRLGGDFLNIDQKISAFLIFVDNI